MNLKIKEGLSVDELIHMITTTVRFISDKYDGEVPRVQLTNNNLSISFEYNQIEEERA